MKKLLRLLPVCLIFSIFPLVLAQQHAVNGYVSDCGTGFDVEGANVTFWLANSSGLKTNLTLHDVVGVAGNSGVAGWYQQDVGNFDVRWQVGDLVLIEIKKGNYSARTNVTLTASGSDQAFPVCLCECSEWQNLSCGSPCNSSEMYQIRLCSPWGCAEQTRCVEDDECKAMNETNCSCTPWATLGCSIGFKCLPNQLYRFRICEPAGCAVEEECIECPILLPECKCGNGVCQPECGENPITCTDDCANITEQRNLTLKQYYQLFGTLCGNKICDPTESWKNCCLDCGCPKKPGHEFECKVVKNKPVCVELCCLFKYCKVWFGLCWYWWILIIILVVTGVLIYLLTRWNLTRVVSMLVGAWNAKSLVYANKIKTLEK